MVTLESRWTQYSKPVYGRGFCKRLLSCECFSFRLAEIKRNTINILFKNLIPLVQLGNYAQDTMVAGEMYGKSLLFNGLSVVYVKIYRNDGKSKVFLPIRKCIL